ncbi:hypothetical protein QTN47_00020 [Danxiaibacter flavus]|uniref:Uncharacterized protein n=1 Tax=Danxiaibacter flavus TaxID=3049108 RepID=A0ABV3Z7L7_9BACT|nr:hypothetical protein QNM32_00020 [Chitinophagaceae bacterium DXS]
MIKSIFFRLLLIFNIGFLASNTTNAQVGLIANNPDKSAALDLSNANKGFLLPRVSLINTSSRTPIVNNSPAQTLAVFNINSGIQGIGASGTGVYYWDGILWKKLISYYDGRDSAWNINGNPNIDSRKHFLGTTDNADLIIKTNGAERFRVTVGGKIGIGTASPQSMLHVNGDTKVGGNLFLDSASIVPPAGVSSLVRDNTTGQVYTVVSSTGNSKPVTYVKFRLTNVNEDSMVVNCDTKIPTGQYTLMVVGSSFSSPDPADGMKMITGYTGTFAPQVVYAFMQNNTWRLAADYKGGKTFSNSRGTWDIYCMIVNNTIIKQLSNQIYDTGGYSSGTGTMPGGL